MLLKDHKLLRALLCLLVSCCIAGGGCLLRLSRQGGMDGTMETAQTESPSVETSTMTEASTVEAPPEASSEMTAPAEESNDTAPSVEESPQMAMEAEGNDTTRAYWIAALVLLILGLLTAALYVIFCRRERALLGAEAELLLAAAAVLLLLQIRLDHPLLTAAVQLPLTALLLESLRGLWSWVRKRLTLHWSAVYRISMRLAQRSTAAVLLFQFLWTTALLACTAASLYFCIRAWYLAFLAGTFLLSAVLAIVCLLRTLRGVNHLTKQIDALHGGGCVEVEKGAFQQAETRLSELGAQRDAAIQRAVTSERFKVELISNVSHDLRTPLTSILGYGELLRKEELSEQGREQLERLNQKTGYMRELVDSLFELTKVSSGAEQRKMERLDLIRLLEQTIGLLDDQLTAAGLTVRRHYEHETLPVTTDGTRLHRVFANLLGNAIKYTLCGTRIHLWVTESDGDYTVRMTNISSYEMDFEPSEIVQRFARGDKARSTKGSGLGLAIAQTYTESVGGSFRVEIDGEQFAAIVTLPKN